MVEIPKRCKAGFIDPELINDGDTVEILDVDVIPKEETKFGKSDRTILAVTLKGNEYRWGINNITNDRLVDTFGGDSSNWIGKKVTIDKQRQIVAGKERNVLYGIPLSQTSVTPAEKPIVSGTI